MGTRALTDLGVSEAEVLRLRPLADRLLIGIPTLPHGPSPRRLRAGRGLEFFELRAWAPGDDARDVDWRASARSAHPLVRRYQDEALATVLLCLDRSASMGLDAGKWRLARQIAAALTHLLAHAGHAVGLAAYSADVDVALPPRRGRASHVRLLARLAALQPVAAGGASRLDACAPLVQPGTAVVVVSDFLAPDAMSAGLERLVYRGGRVQAFQVLSPAEAEVEGEGSVVLRDAESGQRRMLVLGADARKAAARRLEALRAELATHCRRRGIPLTSCASGATWREVILAHVRVLRHA